MIDVGFPWVGGLGYYVDSAFGFVITCVFGVVVAWVGFWVCFGFGVLALYLGSFARLVFGFVCLVLVFYRVCVWVWCKDLFLTD